MVAVLVGDDVLLCQRAAAGAELVSQNIEEVDVEIGGLIRRAVERSDLAGRLPATGVDVAGEQPHVRAGVTRHQLLPHRVDGVTGRHHTALHDLVGVCAGFALVEVEAGRLDTLAVVRALLGDHCAWVDAEEQRDHEMIRPPTPPPTAIPRPEPPPPPLDEVVLVSICMPSLKVMTFSFAHYDSVVATVLGHSVVVHTDLGDLRGSTEGGVGVWRGVPYAEQPVGDRRFLAPGADAVVDWAAGCRRARTAAAAGQIVRRRWT